MRRILMVGLITSALSAWTAPAFADEGATSSGCAICEGTKSDNHLTKTGCQLVRGVTNAGGCWLELANQPRKEMAGGGNVLVGVGKGIGHTCLRLVKGCAEIVTAPMPHAKDGSQIATDCPVCMWNA